MRGKGKGGEVKTARLNRYRKIHANRRNTHNAFPGPDAVLPY